MIDSSAVKVFLGLSDSEADFLISGLVLKSTKVSLDEFETWFSVRKQKKYLVEPIRLSELEGWEFESVTGNLVHKSRKFFSIQGISIETNYGPVSKWDQPIIVQPEIGVLGILAKKFDGVLHFLMQAKMEPGNIGNVQIAPTVQATKSNFTKVHGGKDTQYIEYFKDQKNTRVLFDQLQSEQGGRFYHKRNRNVILELGIDEPIEVTEDFFWLTLGQLRELLKQENIVNMDARTVLSCIHYQSAKDVLPTDEELSQFVSSRMPNVKGFSSPKWDFLRSYLENKSTKNDFVQIRSWFTRLKMKYELNVKQIPLSQTHSWIRDEFKIHHESNQFFNVIGVSVRAEEREVKTWCQPLVQQLTPGIVGLLSTKIKGVLHFLVQAKLEPGNFDILEMAPTVQCITGSYIGTESNDMPPFLEYFLGGAVNCTVLYDRMQSEEGGRFYREANRYVIIEIDNIENVENLNERYIWMTAGQISEFIKYNNYFNVEARSLMSCMGFY